MEARQEKNINFVTWAEHQRSGLARAGKFNYSRKMAEPISERKLVPQTGKDPTDHWWSDRKKFWSETSRTGLFGIFGAVIATLILGTFSDASRSSREIRGKALDEFIHASHQYASVLYNRCEGRGFDWSIYENYEASKQLLNVYFERTPAIVVALDKPRRFDDELKRACDGQKSVDSNLWETTREEFMDANVYIAKLASRRLAEWFTPF